MKSNDNENNHLDNQNYDFDSDILDFIAKVKILIM